MVESDAYFEKIRQKKIREWRIRMTQKTNQKITVYSTNTCPYCTMAKQYLTKKGVPFEDVNVEENQQKAHEMIQKSGQMGVPVIDINGEIIIGFNQHAIEQALSK